MVGKTPALVAGEATGTTEPTGVVTMACLYTEIQHNTGSPHGDGV